MRAALLGAACAAALACVAPADAASPALTRNDFVEGYVLCNNAAWAGNSRATIHSVQKPTEGDRIHGIDSVRTRGFVGEQLYFEGVFAPLEPHRPATLGWALATKAFADRGGFDPAMQSRSAALAAVNGAGLAGASALSDTELEAIATEIALARARGGRAALTPIARGTDVRAPLRAGDARAMLARIGTHFDTGRNVVPKAGAACPPAVLRGLFGGAR
ncbi:MAG TPA: hypothetical protein VHT53_10185 [Candidatus Elarobacter sp.]|nr:hypothetical protein [Candidatus Elarobacter sp.]